MEHSYKQRKIAKVFLSLILVLVWIVPTAGQAFNSDYVNPFAWYFNSKNWITGSGDSDRIKTDLYARQGKALRIAREIQQIEKNNPNDPSLAGKKEELRKVQGSVSSLSTDQGAEAELAKRAADQAAREAAHEATHCGITTGPGLLNCIADGFVYLTKFLLWVCTKILRIVDWIFSVVLKISIVDFYKYANLEAISDGWKIMRDLASIFFIFMLLYAGLAAILQLPGGYKSIVMNVLIAALLINFSIIIPKVVIDITNVITLKIYDNVGVPDPDNPGQRDIGQVIMNTMDNFDRQFIGSNDNNNKIPNIRNRGDKIVAYLGGSIMTLIVAFSLSAGALLFLIRTVVLLLLIVLSPIYFLAIIVPYFKKYASQWKSTLISQAIFAPAYLLPVMVALKMVQSEAFKPLTSSYNSNSNVGMVNTLVLFIMVNGFMIYAIVFARQMGESSAGKLGQWSKAWSSKVNDLGKGIYQRPTRAVLGGGATRLGEMIDKSKLGQSAMANYAPARWARSLLDAPTKARYGMKESIGERTERRAKYAGNFKGEDALKNKSAYMNQLDSRTRKKMVNDGELAKLPELLAVAKKNDHQEVVTEIEARVKDLKGKDKEIYEEAKAEQQSKAMLKAEGKIEPVTGTQDEQDKKRAQQGIMVGADEKVLSLTDKEAKGFRERADNATIAKNIEAKAATIEASQAGQLATTALKDKNDADAAFIIEYALKGMSRKGKDAQEAFDQFIGGLKKAEHREEARKQIELISADIDTRLGTVTTGSQEEIKLREQKKILEYAKRSNKAKLNIKENEVASSLVEKLKPGATGGTPAEIQKIMQVLSSKQIATLDSACFENDEVVKLLSGYDMQEISKIHPTQETKLAIAAGARRTNNVALINWITDATNRGFW